MTHTGWRAVLGGAIGGVCACVGWALGTHELLWAALLFGVAALLFVLLLRLDRNR